MKGISDDAGPRISDLLELSKATAEVTSPNEIQRNTNLENCAQIEVIFSFLIIYGIFSLLGWIDTVWGQFFR